MTQTTLFKFFSSLGRGLLNSLFLSSLLLLSVQCRNSGQKGSNSIASQDAAQAIEQEEEREGEDGGKRENSEGSIDISLLHVPLTQEQREALALETVNPTQRFLKQQRTVFGTIIQNEAQVAHVVTQLSGIAREVNKQCGDVVRQQERLALLESPELGDAVAAYIAALHQRDVAERTLAREERLYKQRLVAENAWIDAETQAKQQRLEVLFAEQKLQGLGLNAQQIAELPHTSPSSWRQIALYAPLKGDVLERDLVVGEWVSAQHAAFTIADLDTVWAQLEIPTFAMESIALDQSLIVVDLLSREHAKGRITYISPFMNPENFTVQVLVELDNHARKWRLSSVVEAEVLIADKESTLTLPKTAIQRIEGQEIVFVEAEEGFAVRPVEVGMSDAHCIEILDGLCEGDRCAADQTFILKSQLVLQEEREESESAEDKGNKDH